MRADHEALHAGLTKLALATYWLGLLIAWELEAPRRGPLQYALAA